MDNRMRHALNGLKDTFPSPDPDRKQAFLEQIAREEQHTGNVPIWHFGNKPFWYAVPAVITAALMIAVGLHLYNRVGMHDIPLMDPEATASTDAAATEPERQKTENEPVIAAESSENRDNSPSDGTTAGDTGQGSDSPAVTEPQTDPMEHVPTQAHHQEQNPTTESGNPRPTVTETMFQTEAKPLPEPTDEAYEPMPMTDPTEPFAESPTMWFPDPEPDEPEPVCPADPVRDDRVKPFYHYTITGQILEEESLGCEQPKIEKGDEPPEIENTVDQLIAESDVIMLASVDQVWYTRAGTQVYTQLDLTALEVYKGDYHSGNQLSVYEYGGYLPVQDFISLEIQPDLNDRLHGVEGTVCIRGLHTEVNTMYVFFLRRSKNPDIPAGAYLYADEDVISRCSLKNGDLFDANGNKLMTESELWRKVYGR